VIEGRPAGRAVAGFGVAERVVGALGHGKQGVGDVLMRGGWSAGVGVAVPSGWLVGGGQSARLGWDCGVVRVTREDFR
jgi:hypothetical protein